MYDNPKALCHYVYNFYGKSPRIRATDNDKLYITDNPEIDLEAFHNTLPDNLKHLRIEYVLSLPRY